MVPLWWYVVLGVVLFVIGAGGVLLRRNILVVLMS
ncbi:NADH-quinone oxidoreductase subunit K, partial [Mesorhizobium sp. M1E.F.Ca.ET.041.01.1.1]